MKVDRISLSRDCVDLDPPASESDAAVGCGMRQGFPLSDEKQGMGAARGVSRSTQSWDELTRSPHIRLFV